MFRTLSVQVCNAVRANIAGKSAAGRVLAIGAVRHSHGEPDIHSEQFDSNYENFFLQPDIDSWQVRKGMNDILGMDLIPDPKIIIAGLKACRKVNDYALAVRWLEGCKNKCGPKVKEIYPWMLQEIQPTLKELGVLTPEEMGYAEPELFLEKTC